MTHKLKTLLPYWLDVTSGRKTFEVRKNDRDYKTGDILALAPIHSDGSRVAPAVRFRVTYILNGGQFGISPEYCVMAIVPIGGKAAQSDGKGAR